MATPFDTPARATRPPSTDCATDNQITRALVPMLEERDWAMLGETQPKHVERTAVLKLVIRWALNPMDDATPPAVSRAIHAEVGRGAAYGERVNAILRHLRVDGTVSPVEVAEKLYAPLTREGASALISWLSGLPRKDRVEAVQAATVEQRKQDNVTNGRPSETEVPAGRYAVETEDGATNGLAFYKVDRPTDGKWAGYVFVKLMQSDEEQRMSRSAGDAILRKIAAVGAEAASARYGHEIGACGLCGRTLTNDESRVRGIGPICAAKAGW